MNNLTWGVDGYGRCFIISIDDPYTIIACCLNAGHARSIIDEIEYEPIKTSKGSGS